MIHGFDVYRMYLAMKLHFSQPHFDYFASHGKTNAKEQTYQQRNDFWFFETLARKHTKEEIQNILLSTFIYSEDPKKVWVGDIKRDGIHRAVVRQKQMERLTYSFMQDNNAVDDYLERKGDSFNSLFEVEHSDYCRHPSFLKLYIQNKISLETFIIYDIVLRFTKQWDKVLQDPLWEMVSLKIKKYKPFLSIDRNKYQKLLKEKFCG